MKQDESMVEIKRGEDPLMQSATEDEESGKYRLLYSKSKVYVHPTAYAKDNIPGFVTLVKRVSWSCSCRFARCVEVDFVL